jgi:diketogulonate reductase-like aldo/keto reductase
MSMMEGNKRMKVSHHSDLELPQIGAGTFEIEESNDILCALRLGFKHIDLAEAYGNLNIVKQAFQLAFLPISSSGLGINRNSIFITMKVFKINNKRHISNLLEKVGLDYFDLLLYHTPDKHFTDQETMEMDWKKLIDEKDSGRVLQIGVSNYYKQHLNRLLYFCNSNGLQFPYANQIMINPYVFPKETIDFCNNWNIKVISYCPLGYVFVNWLLDEVNVKDIASKKGCSPSQVVLSWLLKQGLYAIPRSSNEMHLKSNLESQGVDWQMNGAEDTEFEEKMQSLQKTGDEFFTYLIDTSQEAFLQDIEWGKDWIMQP